MRESFIFYRSFFDAISKLDDKKRLKMYDLISNFALNGEEIEAKYEICEQLFCLIKPQLLANNKRFEDGKKGGRPKKIKTTGFENKKPNNNVNENENVNVNENVNENEKENVVVEIEKQKNLCYFYGEFKNVFLNDSDYGKICGFVNNSAILNELIDELSYKIAQNDEKYKPYNENFPSAHYSHLMKFWKYRQTHPEKFIKTNNNSLDEYSAALQRGIEMYRQKKREKAKTL